MANHEDRGGETADMRMALFDFAFDHAPIGIALIDTRGCVIRGNAAFAKMVGLRLENLEGAHFRSFTHPDDLEADLALFEEVLEGKRDGYTIEKRYVRPDRSLINVRIHVAAMRSATGKVVRFISQIEDITRQKQNERELAERAAQLELAMEAVRGGFWYMDVSTRRFETSDRLAKFIGGPSAARLDLENYLRKVNIEDGAAADLTPLLAGEVDQAVAEYRLDTVLGERWMRCDRRLLRDTDGTPLRIVGVAIDFSEEHRRLEYLMLNSETDALTGILNRRGLAKRFEQLRSADGYVLLALDLDGFKQVNDGFGHPAGDVVLTETARRLTSLVRSSDLVCRTGGDEFVIVIAGDERAGKLLAQRIVDAMRTPITIRQAGSQASEETAVDVRASVGGVWSPAKVDVEDLISRADVLLYQAKAEGKDGWRFREGSSGSPR
jgi:diguanylate cyclase (GGDEF)-like protein/PAS domain S-box-containing protein